MTSPKVMLFLTGKVSCMVMQENWDIIRSLLFCQIRLLARCTNFTQILMLHTAFLRYQWTEAILMCMESWRLLWFLFWWGWSLIIVFYHIWNLVYLCFLQNRALLNTGTLRKLRSRRGSGHITVFNTLPIGHTHEQHISSWPFAKKKLRVPIVKIMSSYARPVFHTGPLSV